MILYLGGLLGNVFSYWNEVQQGDNVVSAGASGAIFAVLGGNGNPYLTEQRETGRSEPDACTAHGGFISLCGISVIRS